MSAYSTRNIKRSNAFGMVLEQLNQMNNEKLGDLLDYLLREKTLENYLVWNDDSYYWNEDKRYGY